jgi:putative hydrolase of the HAD superfamily
MAAMSFRPRAITLDLDDTLWPIEPVIERAEAVLHDWLCVHAPRAAERYPVMAMRALRDQIARDNPQLAHDYSTQRMLSLRHALAQTGHDPAHSEHAYAVFFAARNEVDLYPEVLDALDRIAAQVPIAAVTNGNADLALTPLAGRFAFQLGAREHGAAKPDASIFHAACARFKLAPGEVLHVGDDPHLDVVGAHGAGLRGCWINRHGHHWPVDDVAPHLQFSDLTALADWLAACRT